MGKRLKEKTKKDNEITCLKMHFFNKIKTKNESLEGSYLLVLRQYVCHKKYITTLLFSSFVVVAFLLATFFM
jgi:hypothetical protein